MTNIHRTLFFVTSVIVLALIVFPVFARVVPIIAPNCGFPGIDCAGGETFSGNIQPFIITIINTVIALIGTLTFAFLVFAAFQYVTSQGDVERAEKAKRQVIYALLGVVLALSALIIVNAVTAIDSTPISAIIISYTNMLIILVGTLAVAYLVLAAIQYIISQGDVERAEKAKRQVIYALLGVVLALSALIIVNAVTAIDSAPIILLATPYINMALNLIGILAAIYIIYAGYKYISSAGDEEAATTAKKQITFALIGVFIAGVASIVVDILIPDINGNFGDTTALISTIRTVINAVLSLLALIAAAYIILGGVMYLSSQGDQEKATRAKMQIIYAIVGITVIALSTVIVNFIIANI